MIRTIVLKLSLYPGLGPTALARLTRDAGFEGLSVLPDLSVNEIIQRYGVTARIAGMIHAAVRSSGVVEKHDEWCQANRVSLVLLNDSAYPVLLKHIGAPPVALWVKGRLPASDKKTCALVGSREANQYGKRVVSLLVPALVAHGVVTVSGGALGIDTFVHEYTLAAGGCTIAVVASGLMHSYLAHHESLFEKIVAAGGAIVSPFAPFIMASKGSFPARNRIIAGLSSTCVVVQAAARSGALITAAHALEENREVAAVPGAIDDPLSAGCNELLAAGAQVITGVDSVLALCGVANETGQQRSVVEPGFACEHAAVLQLLAEPATLDDLLEVYKGTPVELQAELFALQVAGKIRKNHAGMWVRCG